MYDEILHCSFGALVVERKPWLTLDMCSPAQYLWASAHANIKARTCQHIKIGTMPLVWSMRARVHDFTHAGVSECEGWGPSIDDTSNLFVCMCCCQHVWMYMASSLNRQRPSLGLIGLIGLTRIHDAMVCKHAFTVKTFKIDVGVFA
jgi:hypothetical protein